MPWRTASAWPDGPPPCTFATTSNFSSALAASNAALIRMSSTSRGKYSFIGLPLTVTWPVP